MHNTNIPSDRELPSTAKLIKSTILAAIIAGVLLVTVVMPSEYGIDPTGVGSVLGLKHMGEIKTSLAKENAADNVKNIQAVVEVEKSPTLEVIAEKPSTQNHEMSAILAPDESLEIKVTMLKGAKVDYVWNSSGGKVNFDVHGDSKKLKLKYQPYYKGSSQKREGTLIAKFDGSHGWFWRNRTKETLTVTIKTNGEYSDIKRF